MRKPTPSEFKSVGLEYGIDQLEFASKEDPNKLNEEITKIRPFSKELVVYSKVLDLEKIANKNPREARKKGYYFLLDKDFKSLFRMTDPTPDFFALLNKHNSIFGFYIPWVIELYKNTLCESERDAIVLTEERIRTTYKKNTSEMFLYHAINPHKLNMINIPYGLSEDELEDWVKNNCFRQNYKPDIIGIKTLYLGDKEFQYVIYARYTKRTKISCSREEWKIHWQEDRKKFIELGIKKKNCTYVEALEKLTKFDFPETWEKFTANRIKQAEINEELVGKYFADCKFSVHFHEDVTNTWRPKKKLTEKEKWYIHLLYQQCMNEQKIETTAEFVRFYHKINELNENLEGTAELPHFTDLLK